MWCMCTLHIHKKYTPFPTEEIMQVKRRFEQKTHKPRQTCDVHALHTQNTCLFFFFLLHCAVPVGNSGSFAQGKPAATESCYPTLINYKVHAGSFRVSCPLNSDMDYRRTKPTQKQAVQIFSKSRSCKKWPTIVASLNFNALNYLLSC